MPIPTFKPEQFTPTKFTTAEAKAWFANHFIKFLKSGFKYTLFTKRFYNQLHHTFGHIAHCDQHGFWSVFFHSCEGKQLFLDHTLNYTPMGDPAWTFSDVERAIQEQVRETNLHTVLARQLEADTEALEFANYQRLKSKFES